MYLYRITIGTNIFTVEANNSWGALEKLETKIKRLQEVDIKIQLLCETSKIID